MINSIKINIIAPNIKSGGAKELLEYLIEYINFNYPSIYLTVYLDVSLKKIPKLNNVNYVYMKKVIEKIYLFNKQINNAIYFGNLPPLRKCENSMVYFHNPYLLMPFKKLKKEPFKFIIKYFLQQIYIKKFIHNVDFVGCQNEDVKEPFIKLYDFYNVKVLPFFRLCNKRLNFLDTKVYDFCYVSLAHPHKGHNILLDAIDILADKNIVLTIALTIEDKHKDLIQKIDSINKKGVVRINNLGLLSKKEVCKLYASSKALIFPSFHETFGLALIEAVDMNLDVIASNLNYVYKVVKPSLVFNPNDVNDIAQTMIKYLNGRVDKSIPLIENKIEELISIMTKGELNVQK